jgi:hypothetical protein
MNAKPTPEQKLIIDNLKTNYEGYCGWIGVVGEDIVMVYCLAFHCSVLINPYPNGGYEQRYCYHNVVVALMGISEYSETGVFKHWKKDHSKNISVSCGNLLFPEGVLHSPENSIGEVDWDITTFPEIYPYTPPLSF